MLPMCEDWDLPVAWLGEQWGIPHTAILVYIVAVCTMAPSAHSTKSQPNYFYCTVVCRPQPWVYTVIDNSKQLPVMRVELLTARQHQGQLQTWPTFSNCFMLLGHQSQIDITRYCEYYKPTRRGSPHCWWTPHTLWPTLNLVYGPHLGKSTHLHFPFSNGCSKSSIGFIMLMTIWHFCLSFSLALTLGLSAI